MSLPVSERSPFVGLEELVRAGRLREAAAGLRKLRSSGVRSWEICLWMGRIEERRGRWEEAEKSYRNALAGSPAGAIEMEYALLLERRGRVPEAFAMLRTALKRGGPAVEIHMALGRLYERSGRAGDAKDAYRKAAKADPAASQPLFELARLEQAVGRASGARGGIRKGTARLKDEMRLLAESLQRGGAAGTRDPRFFDLVEAGLCRSSFLEDILSSKAATREAKGVMEAVLRADPRAAGARTLLAELLIGEGRLPEAARQAAVAFGPEVRGADVSRILPALKLIEAGTYPPVLEAAVLDCVRRRGAADSSQADWYQAFSALLCGARYPQAFGLGEALLDKPEPLAASHALLWPWWRKVRRGVNERAFCAAELGRLDAAARKGGFAPWYAYCRTILLCTLGRYDEAEAEYRHIKGLDRGRYAWMRQPFVLVRLCSDEPDYDGTVEVSRVVLSKAPDHWWVRCRMAEALLARGDLKEGLAEFQRAEEGAAGTARGETLTWHGEVLLWLGRYREGF
ncbi:MAG: tetratricopeptide repeat protein, partial [Elusimicrobiota bacterium]